MEYYFSKTVPGQVEVSAIDLETSMQAIENKKLTDIASEMRSKLQRIVTEL